MQQSNQKAVLSFHQGTLVLSGFTGETPLQCLLWDDRSRQWRAKAIYYSEVLSWLREQNVIVENRVSEVCDLAFNLRMTVSLRPYQEEALAAWQAASGRGTVSLPTGAGKSWVALKAMAQVGQSTLIVLPTIDLMNQWYDLILDAFQIEVGILGGGYHEIRDVTVTTYESAYRHMDRYGNRFGLLIFDEVHHLPAATYSHIPEMSIASHRLGLTATYQRLDGLHGKLERLIGDIVYEKSIKELEGEHLAEYEIVRIAVDLTPKEKRAYQEHQKRYETFIREKGVKFYGADREDFLKQSAYDPEARRAFLAWFESRKIVMGAQEKLKILESLLKRHASDRLLIFTESNDLVYEISETFLVPALTHHTKTHERKWILDSFRKGKISVVVTSKVLNEGVDVPNANVAIILSGSASPVEHVQRLGRILRKGKDKQAVLYELVTRGTKEGQISYRRRQADAYQ